MVRCKGYVVGRTSLWIFILGGSRILRACLTLVLVMPKTIKCQNISDEVLEVNRREKTIAEAATQHSILEGKRLYIKAICIQAWEAQQKQIRRVDAAVHIASFNQVRRLTARVTKI